MSKKAPSATNSQKPFNKKDIRLEWDLKNLFYASEHDSRLEKDILKAEKVFAAFEKKYKNKNFTQSVSELHKALTDYEELLRLPEARRPLHYFEYRRVLNSKDSVAEKRANLINARLTKASNKLLFFEITIGKIPKEKQRTYLADTRLLHFRYYLLSVFLEAKYVLSEAEEKIMNLKSGPSVSMWISGTEKILSNRSVIFDKKTIALPEAIESIDTLPPEKKPELWSLILDELEDTAEVVENEFNAIITDKKISDELRGYKKPYSATVLGYENNERSVETLIDVVSGKGFSLSQKFYKLKAKFHGVASIPYVNKYDPISDAPGLPFYDAVEICRDAFYKTKNEYGAFFDGMLRGGNIDVYPKPGKRGGAFMSSDIGLPTLVFLNHTDTFKSLETLAHEMGHALHSSRSKCQTPLYEHYSTTTAETASTLFENIVFNYMLEQADTNTKVVLLHDRILRDISTIQRQTAFFNFEVELHTVVREQGGVTKSELQKMMQKHLKRYLGPAVEVTDRDGLSYVYISHFRYGFYVYTYTYGILMSNIMQNNLIQNPAYIEMIDAFLSSGGSDSVDNIFKKIGINTLKRETFEHSLLTLESDIKKFEKLTLR